MLLSGALPAFPVEHNLSYQSRLVEKRLRPGLRVLEIGCSAGYFSQRMYDRGVEVFGIDLNTALVGHAARSVPAARFCGAEANRLPFAARSFDAVVMLEVIEHVGDERPVFAEIQRVLKPSGQLYLSTPHAGLFAFLDPFNVKMFFTRKIPGLVDLISRVQRYRSPQLTSNMEVHQHYSLDRLTRLMGGGLKVRFIHRGGLLLFPVFSGVYSVLSRLLPVPALRRACYRIMFWDSVIPYGSLAYNLVLVAERQENP